MLSECTEPDVQVALFKESLAKEGEPSPDLQFTLRSLGTYVKNVFRPPLKTSLAIVPLNPKLTKVTPEEFTIDDVPRAELQKRLNRGEIAPRDEWIPSNDKG